MSTHRFLRRALVVSATLGATGLATAGIASAHVTADVYGSQPEQGGYGAIVLRVPNEEEQAGTVKVEVTIPAEYAISSARTKPVPGWKAEVTKNDVVSKITWTAQPGNEIPAGTTSYQEFAFTAGPLPEDVDTLVLPAAQTYSDGTVANWNQEAKGDEEPEHPAPTVELAQPSGDGHGHGASAEQASAESEGSAHAEDTAPATSDTTARWLGGAGLAVGALGVGFGVGATLRARKQGRS
ncbi:YcnI family copper-binding membrane protein [Prauserella flavalba]|uniref:Nuclear export factor GLE1 n=1 Tax=Prauserella flavalba TaxID=1477506 RepID=A0A318MEJ1_9PSEU|nr:YcnI family protein [Prauserella flavalba]PXY37520.1 nuclear export factor GLE1 [Prauserella flavalba]